jgi:Uma2 family endonuclease
MSPSTTTVPMAGGSHDTCCGRVARQIGDFVEVKKLGTVACNNVGFLAENDTGTVRGPDVSFWSNERLPEVPDGYIKVAPDLAIELISPDDLYTPVIRLIREYCERGVRMVWLVDPATRTVWVHRVFSTFLILTESQTLDGADVLPGFSCKVAELFP